MTPGVQCRCGQCNALLLIGEFTGWVEVHCRRCKRKQTFRFQ